MVKDDVAQSKKSAEKKMPKDGVSVNQLAADIGISVERLLTQFEDAKININHADAVVSEEEKQKLLGYLQQHHGAKSDRVPEKIVLRRAKTSEIKISGSQGAGKTISVQVRKKRTYVKRPTSEAETQPQPEIKPADIAPSADITINASAVDLTTAAPLATASQGPQVTDVKVKSEIVIEVPAVSIPAAITDKEKVKRPKDASHPSSSDYEEADAERAKKKKKTRGKEGDVRKVDVILASWIAVLEVIAIDLSSNRMPLT